MLRPGGSLAIFWNADELADPQQQQSFWDVHARHAPDMYADWEPLSEQWLRDWWAHREPAAATEFGAPESRTYRTVREMSTVDYVAFLDTVSRYRLLDDAVREALYADLRTALGERVTLDIETVLLLARHDPA